MDHELWSHQNKNSHEFSSSTISTELSLISSSFQSTCKHGGLISRTHHYSSAFNSMRNNRMKTWKPNGRNLKNKVRQYWSCSTSLELYDNPWKIKKALTTSDLGKLNRLLFGAELLENLMLPVLDADAQRDAESGMGTPIRVWDVDTMSMHLLILKRWASFKNYVLIGKWNHDFVRRRELKKGDEIGLQWDSYRHCFNFSVLKRIDQC
ncbi:hypothetical protein RIF29_04120 [Crotalaria pallida]|uniref:Uncharacterized protein n=1 Tax=Crotalaria pallida TaxID=3830 RepID=A0AAN9P949_CROPI